MMLVCMAFVSAGEPVFGAGTSTLQGIRTGVHDAPPFTRLVFDLKGDRPTKLEPAGDKFVIEFRQLQSEVKSEYPIRNHSSTVTSVQVSSKEESPRIVVNFRHNGSLASSMFLLSEPPRPDRYRLVIDVFRQTDTKASGTSGTSGNAGETPAKEHASSAKSAKADERSKTAKSESEDKSEAPDPEPQAPPVVDLPEPLQKANEKLDQGNYLEAYSLYSQFLDRPSGKAQEATIALYGLADSYYFFNKDNLKDTATEVLNHYLKALDADPSAASAPWALYRSSRAYQALGNHKKAVENLELVVRKYPKHPATSVSWISLGRTYQEKKSYAEAIEAFRTALGGALEKDDGIEANWRLGESLYLVGQHAKAIEFFEHCLREAPDFYTREPEILKYLGESFFVTKDYARSRDYLFRYLNIRPEAEDKDLILARIAEIFTVEDDLALANKIHDYIQVNYPDSEGYVIVKIRKAEYLEQKDSKFQEEALAIYRELSQKQLTEPLSRLVRLKFALWQHNHGYYEESLKIIDGVLEVSSKKAPNDDFVALRKKVVLDWAVSLFEKKDYALVIRLYEANKKIFSEAGSSDLDSMVAESYGKLKLCSNAVALLEKVVQKETGPKREELLLKIAQHSFVGGDLDMAIEYANKVQASSLQQGKTLLMARISFARKDYQKAVEYFSSLQGKGKAPALSLDVVNSGVYGESLLHLGEYEKALPWFQRAIDEMKKGEHQPEELLHYYIAQSYCYKGLKNNEKAVAVLEAAISAANTEDMKNQLNYDISTLYFEMGQKEKATQRLTKLMSSTKGFWQTAAKQQLGYMGLQK